MKAATKKTTHPGEVVKQKVLDDAKLTVVEAAKRLDINRATLSRLVNGHIGISPEMALRLSKLLPNTDMTFWLNLQVEFDIWKLKKEKGKYNITPVRVKKS